MKDIKINDQTTVLRAVQIEPFDIVLIIDKDKNVQAVLNGDALRMTIEDLLSKHGAVIFKTNFLDPSNSLVGITEEALNELRNSK